MANYCYYEIRVKGSAKACLMVYESMPFVEQDDMATERNGSSCIGIFEGCCKWSVDYGSNDNVPDHIDLEALSESEIEDIAYDYMEYSLRAKSEAFHCEIMVHSWSDESEFDRFDYYQYGELIKRRNVEYNFEKANEFDWDKLEFIGHEGEYDESIDGEQQNEEFIDFLMGLDLIDPIDTEISAQDEERIEGLLGEYENILEQLGNIAEEYGIDLNDSSIGDTGYDLYNWTFTEGKRQSGMGWSIAIPDGFIVIDSEEDRIFEAVPQGMEEDNPDSIPLRILPGEEQPFNAISGENWLYHPYARSGMAEIVGVKVCKPMAQMMKYAPEILSTGFGDICAFILVENNFRESHCYIANIATEGKIQMVRVQTQYMTDEQKESLNKSIIEWIESFKFDTPNPCMPKITKFEDTNVIDDLKEGKTSSFDEAVDRAQLEYNAAVNGRLGTIHYLAENDLIDDSTLDTVRDILECGMEVKEFYYLKADEVVEKLKTLNIEDSTMEKVFNKLTELEEAITEGSVNGELIEVDLPAKVMAIQDKWKTEASDMPNEKERARQEAILNQYKKDHKQWQKDCEEISIKRSAYMQKMIAAKKASLEAAAATKRNDTVNKANALMKQQTDRKAAAESVLNSLGTFKLGEKMNQKSIIKDADEQITVAQAIISNAQSVFNAEMKGARIKAESKKIVFRKTAAEKYPMPEEPKKVLIKPRYEIEKTYNLRNTPAINEIIKDGIVEFMRFNPDRKFTAQEIVQYFDECYSIGRIEAVLKQLLYESRIQRFSESEISYYYIEDTYCD